MGPGKSRDTLLEKRQTVVFSNSKVYNFLRQIALVWLPAATTLYVFLAQTWFWGHTQQVVGTMGAVDTFLGVVLHISSKSYAKQAAKPDGQMIIDNSDPEKTTAMLDLGDTDPHEMIKKQTITLQVTKAT